MVSVSVLFILLFLFGIGQSKLIINEDGISKEGKTNRDEVTIIKSNVEIPNIPMMPPIDFLSKIWPNIVPTLRHLQCGDKTHNALLTEASKLSNPLFLIAPFFDIVSDHFKNGGKPNISELPPLDLISKAMSIVAPHIVQYNCGEKSKHKTFVNTSSKTFISTPSFGLVSMFLSTIIPELFHRNCSDKSNEERIVSKISAVIMPYLIDYYCAPGSPQLKKNNQLIPLIPSLHENLPVDHATLKNISTGGTNDISQKSSEVQGTNKLNSTEQNHNKVNTDKESVDYLEVGNGTNDTAFSNSTVDKNENDIRKNSTQQNLYDKPNKVKEISTSVSTKENAGIGQNSSNIDPNGLAGGGGGGGGGVGFLGKIGGLFLLAFGVASAVGNAIGFGVSAILSTVPALSSGAGGSSSFSESFDNPSSDDGGKGLPTRQKTKTTPKRREKNDSKDEPEPEDSFNYDRFKVKLHTNQDIANILIEKYERFIRECDRTKNKLTKQIENLSQLNEKCINMSQNVNEAHDNLGEEIIKESNDTVYNTKVTVYNAGIELNNCFRIFSEDILEVSSYLTSLLNDIIYLQKVAYDMRELMVDAVMHAVNFDHLIYKDIGKVRKLAKDARFKLANCSKPHFAAYQTWRQYVKKQWRTAIKLGRSIFPLLASQKTYIPKMWRDASDTISLFTNTCKNQSSLFSGIRQQVTNNCVDKVLHQAVYDEAQNVIKNYLKLQNKG